MAVLNPLAGLKAADFHHRVTFQRNTNAANSFGETVETWVDFVTLWSALEPLSGRRLWEAKQAFADCSGIIHTRYYPGITSAMRAKFGTRIFQIQAIINNDERNRELIIYVKEVQP